MSSTSKETVHALFSDITETQGEGEASCILLFISLVLPKRIAWAAWY